MSPGEQNYRHVNSHLNNSVINAVRAHSQGSQSVVNQGWGKVSHLSLMQVSWALDKLFKIFTALQKGMKDNVK